MSEKKKKITKFFVYGTLKEGRPLDRHELKKSRTSVQEATIEGDIYHLGSYPTVRLDGKGLVIGEIHTFPEEHLKDIKRMMDAIEGCSYEHPERSLFSRHKVKATLKDGNVVTAWVYQYTGSVKNAKHLPDGLWEPGL